jgi:2-polyprenyl-6-hydroxyphenyl methylase/3-demethylubiquinone-9 3-methyltransferase
VTTIRNDLTIYETHAADWWTGRSRFMRSLQALVAPRMRYFNESVPSWSGLRVLDVGCGGGFMSLAIAKLGADVIGIDPAPGAVSAAAAEAKSQRSSAQFKVGVGESLPVQSAWADVVVCVDVLEHVADLPQVIHEFARVLKPGGTLLFDTINRNWLASFLVVYLAEDVLGIVPKGTHAPAMFIKPKELSHLLATHQFSSPDLAGLGPIGLNLRGDPIFARLPTRLVMYMGHCTRT